VRFSIKLNLLKTIELFADNISVTCFEREALAALMARHQAAKRIL
jgi:hypothetical protein